MTYCVFCDEEKMKKDVIHTQKNFFAAVGLSLVTPGHVMIITRGHYACFGDLPEGLDQEYSEFEKKLRDKISEKFHEPFLVEYAGKRVQSVYHGHAHFIPLKGKGYEIKSIVEEMPFAAGISVEEVDRKRLREIYRNEGDYVSFKEKGKLYVCHTKGIVYDEKNQNPGLNYPAFFKKKGLEFPGWQNMSEDYRVVDEQKRKETKEKVLFPISQR